MLQKYRDISPGEFKAMDIEEIGRDIQQAVQLNPSIQIPNDFILFGRVVGMLNGLGSQLDPETNIIEISAPYAKRFIQSEEMSPQGALKQVAGAARSLVKLPKLLSDFLVTTGRGETARRDRVPGHRARAPSHPQYRPRPSSSPSSRRARQRLLSSSASAVRHRGALERRRAGILLLAAVYFMRKLRQRD